MRFEQIAREMHKREGQRCFQFMSYLNENAGLFYYK